MTIELNSYQFGFQNPVTLGSSSSRSSAGTASFNELVVDTFVDPVSPLLFESLVSGGQYRTAVLTQTNELVGSAFGGVVAAWALSDVYVTSDGFTGDSADFLPSEELDLAFGAVTEVTASRPPPGARSTTAAAALTSPKPLPSLGAARPRHTGRHAPVDARRRLRTVSIALNSYQFGFQNKAIIVLGSGVTTGEASFDKLVVGAAFAPDSPLLFFESLVSGAATRRHC